MTDVIKNYGIEVNSRPDVIILEGWCALVQKLKKIHRLLSQLIL